VRGGVAAFCQITSTACFFFFSVLTRSLFKTQIRCVRQLFTDLPHFSLKKPVADEWLRVRDALLLTR